MASRPTIALGQQLDYQARIAKLRRSLVRAGSTKREIKSLEAFAPKQRALLMEVFDTIYKGNNDVVEAQKLVEQILKRVSRLNSKIDRTR
jgi:hypothetical protein